MLTPNRLRDSCRVAQAADCSTSLPAPGSGWSEPSQDGKPSVVSRSTGLSYCCGQASGRRATRHGRLGP
eukprot:13037136-Alexandrium_andersonii.AAC.1